MFVAKWYTRASRVRIVIAKFDGRWKLPGGPYPIPELATLVAGIMTTLFLLPRLGQPLLTGFVGISTTAIAVAAMRTMPYSPVKFSTRVHRVVRLYTSPVSSSTDAAAVAATTVSTVRPDIDVLDPTWEPAVAYPQARRLVPPQPAAPDAEPDGWADVFGAPQRSAAAGLFG